MAWTKAKTAVTVGVGVLLATGTTTVAVKKYQAYESYRAQMRYPWQIPGFNSRTLEQAPPQVAVLDSKVPMGGAWGYGGEKLMGTGVSANTVVQAAYDTERNLGSAARMIVSAPLPPGRYDFIASLPAGNAEALKKEVIKKLGVVGRHETREMDVLLLNIKTSGVKGLRTTSAQNNESSSGDGPGYYTSRNQSIKPLVHFLESYFEIPVMDQTGLSGRFDIDLHWGASDRKQRDPNAVKQVLVDQLGLELVPAREPVEMLIVEKAK